MITPAIKLPQNNSGVFLPVGWFSYLSESNVKHAFTKYLTWQVTEHLQHQHQVCVPWCEALSRAWRSLWTFKVRCGLDSSAVSLQTNWAKVQHVDVRRLHFYIWSVFLSFSHLSPSSGPSTLRLKQEDLPLSLVLVRLWLSEKNTETIMTILLWDAFRSWVESPDFAQTEITFDHSWDAAASASEATETGGENLCGRSWPGSPGPGTEGDSWHQPRHEPSHPDPRADHLWNHPIILLYPRTSEVINQLLLQDRNTALWLSRNLFQDCLILGKLKPYMNGVTIGWKTRR